MYRLGCNKDPHDDRDFMFKVRHREIDLPEKVDFFQHIAWRYNQANEGSCVGHGLVSALRNALLHNNQPDVEFSRQMAYYISRKAYLKDEDSGASIRDAIKAARRYGVCPESMWPYLESNMFTRPSDACYKEAEKHQLLVGERVNKNINDIKSAIASGYGVVFGISVFSSFFKTGSSGIVPIPDEKKEENYGGHCMYIAGYNTARENHFDVLNSWGPGWGNKGICHIPFEYVIKHANDLWAVHSIES